MAARQRAGAVAKAGRRFSLLSWRRPTCLRGAGHQLGAMQAGLEARWWRQSVTASFGWWVLPWRGTSKEVCSAQLPATYAARRSCLPCLPACLPLCAEYSYLSAGTNLARLPLHHVHVLFWAPHCRASSHPLTASTALSAASSGARRSAAAAQPAPGSSSSRSSARRAFGGWATRCGLPRLPGPLPCSWTTRSCHAPTAP